MAENYSTAWRKLKERLLKEGGNETVTKCHGLKMLALGGKMRLIAAANGDRNRLFVGRTSK